ncbi:MAG: hypothetical protein ACMUIU_08290 [bacterium]
MAFIEKTQWPLKIDDKRAKIFEIIITVNRFNTIIDKQNPENQKWGTANENI